MNASSAHLVLFLASGEPGEWFEIGILVISLCATTIGALILLLFNGIKTSLVAIRQEHAEFRKEIRGQIAQHDRQITAIETHCKDVSFQCRYEPEKR